MSDQKIDVYPYPAGGWGALRSVAHQLKEQGIPAKGARTLLHANQPDGFDCPGCAWPDRNHGSSFEFCENGAKAVAAEATARRCTPERLAQYTVRELAAQSDYFLEGLGRLTHPMAYDPASDRYLPIEWDAAFEQIARHLKALPDPNQAVFYTSGRTSNEAAFLYQWFVREYGTNNFPDCSNMCHEPSGVGLKGSIGVGKGTVTLDDFTLADTILIFGQNPGTNHPRMLAELRAASKRGARIVSFNPLRERGLERFADPQSAIEMTTGGSTRISSQYYQPRIGGDLAVVKGLLKQLLTWDDEARLYGTPPVLDHAFIAEHTTGFGTLVTDLRAEDWALIERESGLSRGQLLEAANVVRRAKSLIVCWGMGITQHPHAVGTIQMLSNLLLVGGHIGKPGAGACPVRGHSNVQGDRTMGIYEKPSAAFLDRMEQVLGFKPPRAQGFDTVETIAAMADGRAKVFFGMGGNFAAATPDTPRTWAALRRCELTVQVSTKLNRSHVVHGRAALILPCLGRTEADEQTGGPQSVTVEDSMSMVHLSHGTNAPASEHLLSEPAIVARLAEATLGSRQRWQWMVEDYDRIRERIEATLDEFAGFNQRVRTPGGFRLRNTASERVWATASGKAQFHAHPISQDTVVHRSRRQNPMATVFTLATMRSHDQYNTTLYGLDDRYRGVWGQRRVVFIHADDLQALGFKAGDWVDLHTISDDGIDRSAPQFKLVAYDIPRGCLAAYYPETNPLVPLHSVAEGAGTPTSKYIPVRLTASQAPVGEPADHCGLPESPAQPGPRA
ncbi:FdhF/YdeP family oxidoreductase [Aquabacterium sp. CECT 9606]|uniref:FdhF/YdeP family oxidoreductase n=1 Tax=Aquabacterium sp. CECT 9606 TaxID=2845822 RepID=UPI001E469F49|nr:FdhF/YdeP family oxidoreductase [Aquabacterium sp. CECT 9606]CAH0347957.1 Protein YdeP [Aquabacterium sp. CECT 9606]